MVHDIHALGEQTVGIRDMNCGDEHALLQQRLIFVALYEVRDRLSFAPTFMFPTTCVQPHLWLP